MRKQMILLLGMIFFLALLQINACKMAIDPLEDPPDESLERLKELADFANWPGKHGPIREGVDLNKYSISCLLDASIKSKGTPFFYYEAENWIPELIHHSLHWEKPGSNSLTIDLLIAESCEGIHEYAIQRFYNSSMPFELRIPKKDDPVVAGEISFSGGRRFIRNNIYVEIQALGELRERIIQVAKEIDNLLLSKPTASSADAFKPKILRFEASKNVVEYHNQVKLLIEVTDPNQSVLYFQWKVTGAGGADKGSDGNWYYFAADDPGYHDTVTLIVINDKGYFDRASIEITITP